MTVSRERCGQRNRARQRSVPLVDVDSVPFFPFRFIDTDGGRTTTIRNPLTREVHELNRAGRAVLQLCDGYRTWYEIVYTLARDFRIGFTEARVKAERFITPFTQQGMVWWRSRRMEYQTAPPPMAVLWDLTAKCNLRCRHCVVAAGPELEEQLSLDECRMLVNDLADFGVGQVILSGGEPLVRGDFFEIAEHAADRGMTIQVATNGTLIDSSCARRLAAVGAHAQVSLDGVSPSVHDSFRGKPGAWKKTVAGIRNLVREKVFVSVAAVVTRANLEEVPDLYRFVAGLGADCFRIMPFVPFGRGAAERDLEISPASMLGLTIDLDTMKEEVGLPLAAMEFECTLRPPRHPCATGNVQRIGCDGSVAYCTITAAGEVLPCNYFSGVEAESIRDNSFAWIWNNSHILQYFRSLRTADIQGTCRECAWLGECRGSCIAANFTDGDIFQANRHCWIVHEKSLHRGQGITHRVE